ncbi:hypothetical protein GSI_15243 [Ganoderma sinense ZZ0214-1]|uniref:Uncharacterized protein n=1 Tax=Ganoderma sinense ZZ0214-1 TaxID=1077348 RepID=A0A2G8RM12_9APHY|nr:hypothetical protein GSI_15243 [Ganoderma sinense ZZ0214-1]
MALYALERILARADVCLLETVEECLEESERLVEQLLVRQPQPLRQLVEHLLQVIHHLLTRRRELLTRPDAVLLRPRKGPRLEGAPLGEEVAAEDERVAHPEHHLFVLEVPCPARCLRENDAEGFCHEVPPLRDFVLQDVSS